MTRPLGVIDFSPIIVDDGHCISQADRPGKSSSVVASVELPGSARARSGGFPDRMPMKQERPMKRRLRNLRFDVGYGCSRAGATRRTRSVGIRMGRFSLAGSAISTRYNTSGCWSWAERSCAMARSSSSNFRMLSCHPREGSRPTSIGGERRRPLRFHREGLSGSTSCSLWRAAGVEIETTENPNPWLIFSRLTEPISRCVWRTCSPNVDRHEPLTLLLARHPSAMKSWYVHPFGANPGRRACVRCTFSTPRMIETADMPGTNLSFSRARRGDGPRRWTRDRPHRLRRGGSRHRGRQTPRGARGRARRACAAIAGYALCSRCF